MDLREQRIVLWCGGAPNHRALAAKISQRFSLAGIVIDEKKTSHSQNTNRLKIFSLVLDRLRYRSIYNAWKKLQQYYDRRYPSWPQVPTLKVHSINNEQTKVFTKELHPNLIAVSGTGLIKKELLDIPAGLGIVNLHTGLSPYVKGGPNCTNWCIANNDWHLVGNTVMWINHGIDAGNIIASEHIDIRQSDDLFEAQKKVMEQAHDLYLRAIKFLFSTGSTIPATPQSALGKGQLFLTKMWTADKSRTLLRNWRQRSKVELKEIPQCVSLPNDQ